MHPYLAYVAKRLGQFLLIAFIGVNLAYAITHATPIDPVEQSIAVATSFGSTAPQAIESMRQSLRELYGLTGTIRTAAGLKLMGILAMGLHPVPYYIVA